MNLSAKTNRIHHRFNIAKSHTAVHHPAMKIKDVIAMSWLASLAWMLCLALTALRIMAAEVPADTGLHPTLTSIQEIRNLTPEQAALGYPVTVQAVVTFAKPSYATLFIHDGTGGIFVEQTPGKDDATGPKIGDRLEVIGVTGEGMFAPVIKGADGKDPLIQRLGPGPASATRHHRSGNVPSRHRFRLGIHRYLGERGPDVRDECHSRLSFGIL